MSPSPVTSLSNKTFFNALAFYTRELLDQSIFLLSLPLSLWKLPGQKDQQNPSSVDQITIEQFKIEENI